MFLSPSLRGSGLKLSLSDTLFLRNPVSLFTREWIEIDSSQGLPNVSAVSLFTREWIEIKERYEFYKAHGSLPLYEGVD